MKKLFIILSTMALLFTIFIFSAFAGENDVFDIQQNNSDESPGYLFEISEDTDYIEETDNLHHLGGNIYYAETIQDIQEMCDGGDVEYIESNSTLTIFDTPNDQYYKQYQSHYMSLIDAEGFWDYGIEGEGTVIAIIDTGLATGHEDIDYSRIITGYNYVSGGTDTTDTAGHGTFITGIIAAKRNNAVGVAGLLSRVSIVPLKVSNTGKDIELSVLIEAIYDAVDVYGADVINLSLGDSNNSPLLEKAVNDAAAKNVILVAAVGNSGTGALMYPAAYSSVIGVGAVSPAGAVSSFSQHNTSVYVTAPGLNLSSTNKTGGYSTGGSGTSYAAPFVSAMAAAAKSVWGGNLNVDKFGRILQASVTDTGDTGYDVYYGYGIINLDLFAYDIAYYDDMLGHWSYDYVFSATVKGLVNGTSIRTFSPEVNMNRAMFVTILGRYYEYITGTAIAAGNDSFTDTDRDTWYSKYVAWAAKNGIVEGYSDDRFGPNDVVTREHAATLMYRFSKEYLGVAVGSINDSVLWGFSDQGSVSTWAREAMSWAVYNGFIQGVAEKTLSPKSGATRAQAATILVRFTEYYGSLANAA